MKKSTVVFALGFLLICSAFGEAQTSNTSPQTVKPSQPKSPRMYSDEMGTYTNAEHGSEVGSLQKLKMGDRRVLFREDKKQIVMAAYLQDFKSFMKARRASDDYGILELARDEGLFLVPNHVEVIVLETATVRIEEEDYTAVKVRVIKGKTEGKAGWVPEKWVLEMSGAPIHY